MIVATEAGYVYGLETDRGTQLWRAVLGGRVETPAMVVGSQVFVGTDDVSLHALDAATGDNLWSAPGVDRFLAASDTKVYALGSTGNLAAIDKSTGETQLLNGGMRYMTAVPNLTSSRVYLVSPDGLIQCLQEPGVVADQAAEAQPEAPMADEPAEEAMPADDPFAAEPEPVEEPAEEAPEDDPFAFGDEEAESEAPAEDSGDDPFGDDPFADF